MKHCCIFPPLSCVASFSNSLSNYPRFYPKGDYCYSVSTCAHRRYLTFVSLHHKCNTNSNEFR